MSLAAGGGAIKRAILDAGALGPVIEALRTNERSPVVCHRACGAIWNLAAGKSESIQPGELPVPATTMHCPVVAAKIPALRATMHCSG